MIGLPSIVMSMTPPQVRISFRRPKLGKSARHAATTCSMIGRLPRCAYEL